MFTKYGHSVYPRKLEEAFFHPYHELGSIGGMMSEEQMFEECGASSYTTVITDGNNINVTNVCRPTLKGLLEQNYLFVWDSCLRWFMGVNNKNIVHSKSRLP